MNSIFQKHKYILLNIYIHTHTHTHTQEKARREYTKIITAVGKKISHKIHTWYCEMDIKNGMNFFLILMK